MPQPPLIFGHRGATNPAAGVTENTLAAYALAREQGADGVELDVRLTADGSLLLHHDPVMADGRVVADLTIDSRPDSMPTLAEALDVLDGTLVNIELKNSPSEEGFDDSCRVADDVVALLAARRWRDEVLLSSFHAATMDRVTELAPGLSTALVSPLTSPAADSIRRAIAGGHGAIHPFVAFVTAELVDAAHDAGLRVNVWTVNHPESIREMFALEVDGIFTDNIPAVAGLVNRRSA